MSDLIVYVIVLSSFTSLLNIGYPGQLSLAIPCLLYTSDAADE